MGPNQGFSSNTPDGAVQLLQIGENHSQGRVLDPAKEPVPKSNGILFIIFVEHHITLLVSPRNPVAEPALAGDGPESSGAARQPPWRGN